MGREIRRTPVGWEHPLNPNPNPVWPPNKRDWTGQGRHFQPMRDRSWTEEYARWLNDKRTWENGTDPNRSKYPDMSYEEWGGGQPDPLYYRPVWPEGVELGYQLYETVTEGTPFSPSFATPDELADFLVGHLHMFPDREAALRFIDARWAPSFVRDSQGIQPGYQWVAEKDGTP